MHSCTGTRPGDEREEIESCGPWRDGTHSHRLAEGCSHSVLSPRICQCRSAIVGSSGRPSRKALPLLSSGPAAAGPLVSSALLAQVPSVPIGKASARINPSATRANPPSTVRFKARPPVAALGRQCEFRALTASCRWSASPHVENQLSGALANSQSRPRAGIRFYQERTVAWCRASDHSTGVVA